MYVRICMGNNSNGVCRSHYCNKNLNPQSICICCVMYRYEVMVLQFCLCSLIYIYWKAIPRLVERLKGQSVIVCVRVCAHVCVYYIYCPSLSFVLYYICNTIRICGIKCFLLKVYRSYSTLHHVITNYIST